MPGVLLVGAFGQGNPGDEALLHAFLDRLETPVVATSADPQATQLLHGCAAVATNDVSGVLKHVARVDAVVFAGGTIFKRLHPSTGRPPLDLLRKGLVLAIGARAIRKPVAMLGVGAGRLEGSSDRLLVRALSRQAKLLVLRDEESADVLMSAGVPPPMRIGADPAWVLFDGRRVPAQQRDGSVLVALSHLAADGDLSGYLADSLRPLRSHGLRVALLPWQPAGGDLVLAHRTAELLDGDATVVPPPDSLLEAAQRCAAADVVVGLRHHALMAAAVAGVPFVAYAHEPKLRGLARRLYQPAVDGLEPLLLTREILDRVGARGPDRALVEAEIDRAEDGFRLLRVLLSKGRSAESESVAALPLGPTPWPPSN